ncbi:hypothetical protein [Nocardioides sp.]|uniref:hypothetical protein n=1 Tax=Nocardioides sp. TaxID=35761 RepID=UPI002BB6083D|nr:hypothetical protein [Nocardioides sp.]HXH81018.1 hypothetical protein [Nocardioides sp.]
MPDSIHAGDLLADRYRLDDLLTESAGGRFWLAHDLVLHRPVAVHLIARTDERAEGLMEAARRTAPYHDRRLLRVLDADETDECCYVVNEWGQGTSLDNMLGSNGPLQPRRAAWVTSEIADSLARAHEAGLDHGRMVPENVLIDLNGQVRIIGFAVDAALHGLPTGRQSADLVDTAGVLYAALTGKWAGVSSSHVAAAPTEHGQVMRPRRVRAGIPRQLDDLCDQVINADGAHHRSAFDLTTMTGVVEALREFVGDPTGLDSAESWLDHHAVTVAPAPWAVDASSPQPPSPTVAVRQVEPTPDSTTQVVPTSDSTTEPAPDLPPGPTPQPGPEPSPHLTEMPTQAGIPVFDENNDVGWIQARSTIPVPPPPHEETQAKPLFAPEPAEGQPVRRARPGATAAPPRDYWPWETGTGVGTGIGTGVPAATNDSTDHVVPGRSWFRLAMSVAIGVLLLVAGVAAYQLGVGNGDEPDDEPTASAEPTPVEPTPFAELTAVDFDPQGAEPREENPELVPLALDGDTATSWQTSTYKQDFGPTGLKDGVGLLVDLGSTRSVREIEVATLGGPTTLSVYVEDKEPTGVAELTPVGNQSGNGVLTISLDQAVSGRYVTVWLTSIPPIEGEFRGAIAEVAVLG